MLLGGRTAAGIRRELDARRPDPPNPRWKAMRRLLDGHAAALDRLAAEDAPEVPALHGWRREVFGEAALALKRGRLALGVLIVQDIVVVVVMIGVTASGESDSSASGSGSEHLRFMFTGSQDRTIKMWDLYTVPLLADVDDEDDDDAAPVKCKSLTTHKAHDKDINALDVAPNDRLLVSGSQDRTAKVWEIEYVTSGAGVRGELRLLGTCKGHKRGVWCVRFGRAERVLATGSGDKTVKLWNLEDFTCVKTFEGHTNSVLRVDFINAGMQMVSSASDGLVKLWNVRDETCAATMDNHEDKVGMGNLLSAVVGLSSVASIGFGSGREQR